MKRSGFTRCISDVSVYIRRDAAGLIVLALYVDDIVLMAHTTYQRISIKKQLSDEFRMTDGGEISYILGIQIQRNRPHSLLLEQSRFAKGILSKFGILEASDIKAPVPICIRDLYTKKQGRNKATWTHSLEAKRYRSILGSVRYLVSCTRPDLSFAAGLLSQFMHDPKEIHQIYANRLLHYIGSTRTLGIVYRNDGDKHIEVTGYTDANWASDLTTRKSTGGYVFKLAGGPISWKSKRQPTVSMSSCEAKYKAATDAAKEALRIGNFLKEVNVKFNLPHVIFCDSIAAIDASKKPKQSEKLKHLDIQEHFIRQKVEEEEIQLIYISTQDNAADFLTKSLQVDKHRKCIDMLGMEF
ncbi:hypothetical protein L7F22_044400 [Adiantum nelumboides]|nr:hypothetical protein [Adiantum nelumboides]